jgi:hypothetical protein
MSKLKKLQFALLALMVFLFVIDFFGLITFQGKSADILKLLVFVIFAFVSFRISNKNKSSN